MIKHQKHLKLHLDKILKHHVGATKYLNKMMDKDSDKKVLKSSKTKPKQKKSKLYKIDKKL